MKKIFNWRFGMGVGLVALTVFLYLLHYGLFHDWHHIFIYFWGDVAFIPLEVLVVTLIIHHLLEKREKKSLLNKMNMLIGAFFSEAGTELLKIFSEMDPDAEALRKQMKPTSRWGKRDYARACKFLNGHPSAITVNRAELSHLKDFLLTKRQFLMSLLANPTLLEHDAFTDLLWAVFHLTEELSGRKDIGNIPETDVEHVTGDIKRAYKAIAAEWLDYMSHLQSAYPYLFSLAVRRNPFDPQAKVEVV